MTLNQEQINRLLSSIKNSISIVYTDNNIEETLTRKIKGSIADLITSGVKENVIFSEEYEDLVFMAIETYVIDNWILEAGKRVQSPVYLSQVVKLSSLKVIEDE